MRNKWIAKALAQKIISYANKPEKINYFFQKNITKGVLLTDEYFCNKIGHANDHIKYFRKYYTSVNNNNLLELGTGWYPIVPLSMFICDVGVVTSIDIQNWLTKEGFISTIQKFKDWHIKGWLIESLPFLNEEKLSFVISLIDEKEVTIDRLKESIGLKTHLQDARHLDFDDNYFDFICSNNTFEHIYPEILSPIIDEFSRVIKKGGVMSHFIDLSDHFAHFDESINIYNFLKFSKKKWSYIDNSIQPQNRLRWPEYLELYHSKNIKILEQNFRDGDVVMVEKTDLDDSFKKFKLNELAISHGYIVSRG